MQLRRGGNVNAQLDFDGLRRHCRLDDEGRKLLAAASDHHALSPRACHRILKVSRTLADLDRAAAIRTEHLAEAISYHGSSARADRRC